MRGAFLSDFFSKIIFRCRSIYGFIVFHKFGKYIKLNARIGGKDHIDIGRMFGAGEFLWLEAIEKYQGDVFEPSIKIGDYVSMSNNVHIACINHISIGNNVLIGSNVHITDHSHGNYRCSISSDSPDVPPIQRNLFSSGEVHIGNNVWIADGVVVLPNVSIGSGAIIGANSVVVSDIPDNVIAAGVPAKVLKKYNTKLRKWERC